MEPTAQKKLCSVLFLGKLATHAHDTINTTLTYLVNKFHRKVTVQAHFHRDFARKNRKPYKALATESN